MQIKEIHFDTTNRCRVVAGVSGRTFYSTPQAVGLALLATIPEAEQGAGIIWYDYLSTHGVAVGTRRDSQIHLAVIPPKARTVQWTDSRGQITPLVITFPHVFALLLLNNGICHKAGLFLIDATRLVQASVTSAAPLVRAFPYGNVHDISGNICWGEVATADVRCIKDLEDLFFNSGFNHDLFRPTVADQTSLPIAVRSTPGGILPGLPSASYRHTIPAAIVSLLNQE